MYRTAAKLGTLVFAAALTCMVGCAAPKASPIASNAPEWVNKGSGSFKDAQGGQVFYGVGIAQGIRNRALQVTAADDRGRAEIAKIMNSYIVVLTKDYMASTTAGDMTKSSEEQHVSQVLKNFAKFTLNGSTPVDHWKDVDFRCLPEPKVHAAAYARFSGLPCGRGAETS